MKAKFLVIGIVTCVCACAWTDDRFDIVSKVGRNNSIMTQPSYETEEGKALFNKLERVSAHRFDGKQFWNENSKKVLVLCWFNPKKEAYVFVDKDGTALFIEGCRDYTFFNRILVIDRPLAFESNTEEVEVTPPEPKHYEVPKPINPRPRVIYQEFDTGATYGEYSQQQEAPESRQSERPYLELFGQRLHFGNRGGRSSGYGRPDYPHTQMRPPRYGGHSRPPSQSCPPRYHSYNSGGSGRSHGGYSRQPSQSYLPGHGRSR